MPERTRLRAAGASLSCRRWAIRGWRQRGRHRRAPRLAVITRDGAATQREREKERERARRYGRALRTAMMLVPHAAAALLAATAACSCRDSGSRSGWLAAGPTAAACTGTAAAQQLRAPRLLIYPSVRVTSVVNSKRARAVDDGRAPLPPVRHPQWTWAPHVY